MNKIIFFLTIFILGCQSENKITPTKAKSAVKHTFTKNEYILEHYQSEVIETYIDDFLIIHYYYNRFEVILKDTLATDYQSEFLKDTIFEDDEHIILSSSYVRVFRKYETKHDFSMYKVKVLNIIPVAPDTCYWGEYEEWYWFKEGIKIYCEEGINFAGHYTFARINCGCCCQMGAVIDRINGKIYGVFTFDEEYDSVYGIEFKKDSKMVFVNTGTFYEDYPNYYELTYVYPRKYIWNGSDFERIE